MASPRRGHTGNRAGGNAGNRVGSNTSNRAGSNTSNRAGSSTGNRAVATLAIASAGVRERTEAAVAAIRSENRMTSSWKILRKPPFRRHLRQRSTEYRQTTEGTRT